MFGLETIISMNEQAMRDARREKLQPTLKKAAEDIISMIAGFDPTLRDFMFSRDELKQLMSVLEQAREE